MLYRPLFWTSFWCEDWLAASSFRGGATNFLITSASSKTAFCLAYLIRKRFATDGKTTKLGIVGLTSAKNKAFTEGLGLYDHVLQYGSFRNAAVLSNTRAGGEKWIYADVAGNDELNATIAAHFSAASSGTLVAHITLGATNLSPSAPAAASSAWSQNTALLAHTSAPAAPGAQQQKALPAPESFFMPEWLVLRKTQLSIAQITQMQARAWADLMRDCRAWVRIERVRGGAQVLRAYAELSASGVGPEKGLVWSLWDDEGEGESMEAKL